MKCVLITDPVDAFCAINRVEQKCNLVEVFGDGHTREEIYDIFMYQSRIYKFMSDDFSKLLAIAMLEDHGDRRASIHFSMFEPCHILRGYKLLISSIYADYDVLGAYISNERQDIRKLLSMIGFNIKKLKNGYYYGQSKKSGKKSGWGRWICSETASC